LCVEKGYATDPRIYPADSKTLRRRENALLKMERKDISAYYENHENGMRNQVLFI